MTLHQKFEEKWGIFGNHSETSSVSDETGSDLSADIKHFPATRGEHSKDGKT